MLLPLVLPLALPGSITWPAMRLWTPLNQYRFAATSIKILPPDQSRILGVSLMVGAVSAAPVPGQKCESLGFFDLTDTQHAYSLPDGSSARQVFAHHFAVMSSLAAARAGESGPAPLLCRCCKFAGMAAGRICDCLCADNFYWPPDYDGKSSLAQVSPH